MSSFWLILKQQWTIEEISIFSNSSYLEWKAGLSDTNLKGTIPARFGVIWFSAFRVEDLNVIFYQNMPNLHNQYKSDERKISQKNPEYMLKYSLPCTGFIHLFCEKIPWLFQEFFVFPGPTLSKLSTSISEILSNHIIYHVLTFVYEYIRNYPS